AGATSGLARFAINLPTAAGFGSPEGTQTEPSKHQGKACCQSEMARSSLPCVKRIVLAISGKTTCRGEYQKSETSDFQPELMGYAGKVLQGGARTAHDGTERPAALHLLSSDAGSYPQFAGRGNVCHSSRF